MLLFALDDEPFARGLAQALDVSICAHEERVFPDGERKLRPLADPRGADAYVVHGLHGGPADSPHDKLCRLLMFIATLRDHGAGRVSAVVPYLAYARKDRRTQPFDPLGTRCVAQLLEAVGTAQVFTLEAHNVAACENAFRIPVQSLPAHPAFEEKACALAADGAPVAVASPDPGGVKRAQLWREALERRLARAVGFAMVDKRRSGDLLGSSDLVAGEVRGARVLLLDDLVASGETLRRAALALRRAGAASVHAFAAHGLFVDAGRLLADEAVAQVVVCDSVPPFRLGPPAAAPRKLETVSCVPMFAQALRTSAGAWWR